MPKQFDLIVFDWDGTLANSTQMIIDCMRQSAMDANLPVPSQQAASQIIGLGMREAVRVLFGDLAPTDYQRLTERYRHHYFAQDEATPLFDGVKEALPEFRSLGFELAVATGKGRHGLNKSLEMTGLAPYIQSTRTVDECFSKPHPQMLEELMEVHVVLPTRTLMVGDTSFDLQMAKNAGTASLGVSYGAHEKDTLLGCDPLAIVDSFEEVRNWILQNG